jgi:hypothetical protein
MTDNLVPLPAECGASQALQIQQQHPSVQPILAIVGEILCKPCMGKRRASLHLQSRPWKLAWKCANAGGMQ